MKPKNTTINKISSLLSLAMLAVMVSAIVVLARAPDYAFDPARMKLAGRHAHHGAQVDELTQRFEQAVLMLHAKQYDNAVMALHRVIELSPRMTEAYVNMGYAFIGLKEYGPASKAFEKAIDLNLDQANAYYGLGMAYEGLKDYEGALGAMRSYIHLSPPDDPFVPKARAALWEWEAQLGRIPGVKPAPPGTKPEGQPLNWSAGHKPLSQK